MADDRWLSVDAVADYLGVKRFTVYRWIDRRGLPAHKSGKLWLLRKDEVDRWVRSGSGSDLHVPMAPAGLEGKEMFAARPVRHEDHDGSMSATRQTQLSDARGESGDHLAVRESAARPTQQLDTRPVTAEGRRGLGLTCEEGVTAIPGAARTQIGVVMALASGVDMPLRIEALSIAGDGKVLPVGSVGRVMSESTAAAVAYVMSHLGELSIQAATLALTDIAIVAEIGDIPAQSDTLGAAVAVGLASALTGTPLRRWTAIAGRIAPDGCLLPVDDIPQRLRAAVRGGIREAFVPMDNAGQAESLPFLQDWPVKVIPTAHVNKILQLASAPGQLDMFRMVGNGGPKA